MKFVLTQHPQGGLFAIHRDDHGNIIGVAGPLGLQEAQEWFVRPSLLTCTPADIAWAQQQAWQAPDAATMAPIYEYARRKQRLANANRITATLVALGLIGIVAVSIGAWVAGSNSRSHATATPSGSYAYRNIPMNQLTGTDLMSMSFPEREHFVAVARQNIHCPSNVTDNDLTISLTQVAQDPNAASQKATALLASIMLLAGCVT